MVEISKTNRPEVEISGECQPGSQRVKVDGVDISGTLRSATVTVGVGHVPKVVLEFAHPTVIVKQSAEVVRMASAVRSQLEIDLLWALQQVLEVGSNYMSSDDLTRMWKVYNSAKAQA